ncbi:UNVERIFIED_CONTAM: hypothetical protein PYX00_011710 [Menopon gallinae]|uniref:Uncharacterized protein n=1 Tax=Menopon gallinae TaxID=328185 RepID=A0AAW2H8E8_9NEOP
MGFDHDYLEAPQLDGEQPPVWKDEEDVALRRKFELGQLGVRWNTKNKERATEDRVQRSTSLALGSDDRRIFECQARVRKIIPRGSLVIVVDSFGCVHIVEDIRSKSRRVSRVKLGYFNIADAAVFDGKVLCVGKNTFIMKEVDIKRALDAASCTGALGTRLLSTCSRCTSGMRRAQARHGSCSCAGRAVSDIMKDTGERSYRKIHVCDKIYVLGDMLTVMDRSSYEIIYQIQNSTADFAVVDGRLYCLVHNGDILVYKDRTLVKKASFEDKFSYTKIDGAEVVYLMAGNCVKVLNANLELVSEKECGFDVVCLAENDRHVAVAGSATRSINLLLKPRYKGVPNFPSTTEVVVGLGA